MSKYGLHFYAGPNELYTWGTFRGRKVGNSCPKHAKNAVLALRRICVPLLRPDSALAEQYAGGTPPFSANPAIRGPAWRLQCLHPIYREREPSREHPECFGNKGTHCGSHVHRLDSAGLTALAFLSRRLKLLGMALFSSLQRIFHVPVFIDYYIANMKANYLNMIKKILFVAMCNNLLFLFCCASANVRINDYHQIFVPGYDADNNLQIAIRSYDQNAQRYFLVVDPWTFTTKTTPAARFRARKARADGAPIYFTMAMLRGTPYFKALWKYTSSPSKLENDGVTQSEQPVGGVFLTIDMCPALNYFERDFFNLMVRIAQQSHKAMPIAVSITGLWMIEHQKEFAWLAAQNAAGRLKITWVNHSFSHVYYSDLANKDNFLLNEQTNLPYEILDPERMLLENGLLPSVFFRAPGLVADERLLLTLRRFGLIPLGSNAWLAKGEQPQPGSIILVHGNSNEHSGIQILMPMLRRHALDFLPLQALFAQTRP